MKVLVTAAQFSHGISGVQRHALMLIRCLLQQQEMREVHVALAPWQESLLNEMQSLPSDRVIVHVSQMNRGVLSRNEWHYRRLPRLVKAIRPDIVHLTYPVPTNRSHINTPTIVTLHDLYPYDIPENFGAPKGLFNRLVLRQCLRSVDAIACVSDATLSRLKRHLPHDLQGKALRIHNCVEAFSERELGAPYPELYGNRFLLSVAQHRANKNIPLLIEVFRCLLDHRELSSDTRLAIVGITGPETPKIRKTISRLKLVERVLLLEGLTGAELQWCYRNCELLVAPSRIEGFGLPVAEATLAGCRIVCSDIPAFREINEEDCHFVELGGHAAENLARGIVIALRQSRPDPIELPKFSSQVIGAQYSYLYRQLSSPDKVVKGAEQQWRGPLVPNDAGATFYRQAEEKRDGI